MEDSVRVKCGLKWLDKRQIEDTIALNQRARFAASFIERWGAVAATPDDGMEDSAGRQALRMMTPTELVTRACETADLLFAGLIANGWAVEVPEAEEVTDDKEN